MRSGRSESSGSLCLPTNRASSVGSWGSLPLYLHKWIQQLAYGTTTMGLDMYLAKKMYVKNYDHMKPKDKHKVTVKLGGKLRKDINPDKVSYVTEEVMYWRKANHIHKWFVDNVQGGKDDCAEYFVSREQLEVLLADCKRVLASSKLIPGKVANGYRYGKNASGEYVKEAILEDGKVIEDPTAAQDILPCQEGFFFGHTEYDEWYLKAVEETVRVLEEELKVVEKADGWPASYYYQSSW